MKLHIPELDHFSRAWIVTRKVDNSLIGEFYERSNVEKFNFVTCRVETSMEYLTRINREIRTCKRCGSEVVKSEVAGYSHSCNNCDEDLYEFETKVNK